MARKTHDSEKRKPRRQAPARPAHVGLVSPELTPSESAPSESVPLERGPLESAPPELAPSERPLTEEELCARFLSLTHLLYDTNVTLGVLERELVPYLAPDVEFVDPLVHAWGQDIFRTGLRGFHCAIHFNFEAFQIDVQVNRSAGTGRVLVDGIMHLRQLVVYTYPLRTVLVIDFRLTDGGRGFQITRLDEMWSLGDLLANVPGIGRIYDVSRRIFGQGLARLFHLSCEVATRLRPALLS